MTLNALRRLIRTLLVALGAPACTIARVWRCEARAISGFAHPLERCQKRGWWLRYNGENDATVAERIVRLEWIAQAPDGERRDMPTRHLARRMSRGHLRACAASSTPASWSPPSLAVPALAIGRLRDPLMDIDAR